ncbi:MAG: peptidoglycan DD-metalloendopeptidase family protein [Polyangia bacterium]
MPVATCCICRDIITGGERFVLVRRGREEVHCSQSCLVANVQSRQRARAAVRRRWLLRVSAVALVVIGAPKLWHRIRLPQAQSISLVAEDVRPAPRPRPAPVLEGPAWPPTDDDWLFAFQRTVWSYPLPGPIRRPPAVADGHSVDVPAELWGEHVYAVHEGTVDHLQHAGGEVSLRLVHFGGMVFTHYAHLAAVPRTIKRGAQVKAGDVIGSVGDTGTERPGHFVRFGLSIRPSSALPEVFWDPAPLMATWPMQLPTHGTVAGFVPTESDLPMPPVRHHPR